LSVLVLEVHEVFEIVIRTGYMIVEIIRIFTLKKKYYIIIFTIVFGLLSCRKQTTPFELNHINDQYKITFVSDRDKEKCFQLYIMNSDGNNQTRLTRDDFSYYHPRFSPDGKKIVFYSSTYNDNDDIYIINSDGSDYHNLTKISGNDNYPQFSPDGSKIVFTSDRDGNREIYIMDSDGENQHRLTVNSTFDHAPQFSPDGSKILFYSIDDHWTYDVYIIDVDGDNLTHLTAESQYTHVYVLPGSRSFFVYFYRPRFSPDGTKIVFTSYSPTELDFNIYIMDSNGSQQIRLTSPRGLNFAPIFSPDGSKIIFMTHRGKNFDIYTMDLNGKNQIPLYDSVSGHAIFSQVSPCGSKILLTDDNIDNDVYKIYIMNSDGSEQLQLTYGSYEDLCPRFQPNADSIVMN